MMMVHSRSLDIVDAAIWGNAGFIPHGVLQIRNGEIHAVCALADWNSGRKDTVPVHDAGGAVLVPGFVDVHVHGGGGGDFMSAAAADMADICAFHAARGTTSLLATTLTAEHGELKEAIRAIVRAKGLDAPGAEIAGIHLEGPYLNKARCGAQNPQHIRDIKLEELTDYLEAAEGHVRLITLAPEKPNALAAIRLLTEQGVMVSIGHSDATLGAVREAVAAGAAHVTHLFNGMRPLHHREPGVVGAGLMLDELAVELICDGIHVSPALVAYVARVKPQDKLVLITDCIAAAGLPDGAYDLGGLPTVMQGGVMRLQTADGTEGSLAGSTLTLDRAFRNFREWSGLPLPDALRPLTANPARQAGLAGRKGTLEPGKDADFLLLDDDFQVAETWVKGRRVFSK